MPGFSVFSLIPLGTKVRNSGFHGVCLTFLADCKDMILFFSNFIVSIVKQNGINKLIKSSRIRR